MSIYFFLPSTTSEPPPEPEPSTTIPLWAMAAIGMAARNTTQYVALPLGVNNLTPVRLKTTDNAPARMVQLIQANGIPFPLTNTATVAYRLRNRQSSTEPDVEGAATVESRAGGIVKYTFTSPLPAAGNYYEEWVVTDGAAVVTFPGDGYIAVTIGNTLAG